MTLSFQNWMQAVWASLIEPADTAAKVLTRHFSRNTLWSGLILAAILNVLLLALVQVLTPVPVILERQIIALSPFVYTLVFGCFLSFLVLALVHVGRILGGTGTLDGALMLMIWFQAISLTLETIQLGLLIISPGLAGLFGMMSLGAIIWVFVNFINVLHGFKSVGKTILLIVAGLTAALIGTGIVMGLMGIVPQVGDVT